jgi:hypothetical protein
MANSENGLMMRAEAWAIFHLALSADENSLRPAVHPASGELRGTSIVIGTSASCTFG